MRVTRRALAGLLFTLVALAGCGTSTDTVQDTAGAGYQAGDGSWTAWEPGERGEPVALAGTTYDGQEVDLADWRGEVVVLNFWYAACPPCRVEAPDLAAIHADYSEAGVRMLGVNPRDDPATAQAFERTFEVPYPSVDDRAARGVAALQGVVPLQAMPTTVVLDTQGRVAGRVLGQIDPGVVRGMIDDVLAEPAQ
ncbi:Peroxiredoxin [Georgenia satyanarayanai]|uniref:Peroxiredoxin n=1 Tax=Georgenia satyanarayanai TaxID=860221 RepID=A0A2Y9AXU6_9MICO|nr:TlpA disulfide reductase family protein [Georgenia satyanarayanai]PYF96357.1 peroxiredoxin [Georgenia satyanarayanai]SSA46889.1 Peroxiredoxin [Georgenia satyanarayanai]